MADQHEAHPLHRRQPGDDGPIIAEHPVAVQLDEVVQHLLDVVRSQRPIGVPGDVDPFPRGQFGIDVLGLLLQPVFELHDLA